MSETSDFYIRANKKKIHCSLWQIKNPHRPHTHTPLHTLKTKCPNIWYHTGLLLKGKEMLFNDALNTFYLWLYGVEHMLKDHSDSERGNPLPPHGLLYPINSKGSFICTIPQTGLHIPWPLLHQSWSTGWNEK